MKSRAAREFRGSALAATRSHASASSPLLTTNTSQSLSKVDVCTPFNEDKYGAPNQQRKMSADQTEGSQMGADDGGMGGPGAPTPLSALEVAS